MMTTSITQESKVFFLLLLLAFAASTEDTCHDFYAKPLSTRGKCEQGWKKELITGSLQCCVQNCTYFNKKNIDEHLQCDAGWYHDEYYCCERDCESVDQEWQMTFSDGSCPKKTIKSPQYPHCCIPSNHICGLGTYKQNGHCKPCPIGHYRDEIAKQTCWPCLDCGILNRKYLQTCSAKTNSKCGTCLPGYEDDPDLLSHDNKDVHKGHMCRKIKPSPNEYIEGSTTQGGRSSSEIMEIQKGQMKLLPYMWVIIVLLSLLFLIGVIIFLICCWKRWKKQRRQKDKESQGDSSIEMQPLQTKNEPEERVKRVVPEIKKPIIAFRKDDMADSGVSSSSSRTSLDSDRSTPQGALINRVHGTAECPNDNQSHTRGTRLGDPPPSYHYDPPGTDLTPGLNQHDMVIPERYVGASVPDQSSPPRTVSQMNSVLGRALNNTSGYLTAGSPLNGSEGLPPYSGEDQLSALIPTSTSSNLTQTGGSFPNRPNTGIGYATDLYGLRSTNRVSQSRGASPQTLNSDVTQTGDRSLHESIPGQGLYSDLSGLRISNSIPLPAGLSEHAENNGIIPDLSIFDDGSTHPQANTMRFTPSNDDCSTNPDMPIPEQSSEFDRYSLPSHVTDQIERMKELKSGPLPEKVPLLSNTNPKMPDEGIEVEDPPASVNTESEDLRYCYSWCKGKGFNDFPCEGRQSIAKLLDVEDQQPKVTLMRGLYVDLGFPENDIPGNANGQFLVDKMAKNKIKLTQMLRILQKKHLWNIIDIIIEESKH